MSNCPSVGTNACASCNLDSACTSRSLTCLFGGSGRGNGTICGGIGNLFRLGSNCCICSSCNSSNGCTICDPTAGSFGICSSTNMCGKDSGDRAGLNRFFPFSSTCGIFSRRNGGLSPGGVISKDAGLGRRFNVSVAARFIRPGNNGAAGNRSVIFRFSNSSSI